MSVLTGIGSAEARGAWSVGRDGERGQALNNENSALNGFSVGGVVLGALTFIGTFYVYIARNLPPDSALLAWFPFFFPGKPILAALALGLSIAGVVSCRRHSFYKGKTISYVGLGLSGAALVHWAGWALLAHRASGYA